MNQEAINKSLTEKDSGGSKWQSAVVDSVRKYMRASANKMSQYQTGWDANSYIYRGYRMTDKEDRDAAKDGEPPKIIVPVTYAQIQTALSFILSTYQQRKNIFELQGLAGQDERLSFAMSTDLQYQLTDQKFMLVLYYWLLDAFKQGVGIVRCDWDERFTKMRVGKQVPDTGIKSMLSSVFGKAPTMKSVESIEKVLAYQGNKIVNVSPYAFYPDPTESLAEFQNGIFVGHEEEVALVSVETREGEIYFGTDMIPKTMGKQLYDERPRRVKGPFADNGETNPLLERSQGNRTVIRTEMEICLSEKKATELWGANFGDGTDPVKWIVTVANDQKLIRFEPSGYFHGNYNYSLFEFSPDHDAFFNPGLADTISELQTITTFFLNSHIVNVRKIIANRFIVDPTKVEMDDIKSGSIFIRTKGAQGDVRRAIEQLQTSDITKSHVADMETLQQLTQLITGVSDNALGQYSSGRRSGTEARNVNAGSSARLKMHATLAWLQGIQPLGRQMLSNTRQWRTKDVFSAIIGEQGLIDTPYEQVILTDPQKLAGGYDFCAYDATFPTDRQQQAGALQQLFEALIQNPETMKLLNVNPMKLLQYIAQLYNIKNMHDFDLQPLIPQAPGGGPQPIPGLNAPQPQVVPNQEAADRAGAGAKPVDFTGDDVLKSLMSQTDGTSHGTDGP